MWMCMLLGHNCVKQQGNQKQASDHFVLFLSQFKLNFSHNKQLELQSALDSKWFYRCLILYFNSQTCVSIYLFLIFFPLGWCIDTGIYKSTLLLLFTSFIKFHLHSIKRTESKKETRNKKGYQTWQACIPKYWCSCVDLLDGWNKHPLSQFFCGKLKRECDWKKRKQIGE